MLTQQNYSTKWSHDPDSPSLTKLVCTHIILKTYLTIGVYQTGNTLCLKITFGVLVACKDLLGYCSILLGFFVEFRLKTTRTLTHVFAFEMNLEQFYLRSHDFFCFRSFSLFVTFILNLSLYLSSFFLYLMCLSMFSSASVCLSV